MGFSFAQSLCFTLLLTLRVQSRRLQISGLSLIPFISVLELANYCLSLTLPCTDSLSKTNKNWEFPGGPAAKVPRVKAMVFPIAMYERESWIIKKAEHQRIDAFKLWCWKRLLRVPWTARRSNQSILKDMSLKYSLEGLKPKLQYLGRLIQRVNSLEKTDAGKDGGQEEKGAAEDDMVGWHHRLNEHEFEQTEGESEGQGDLACCSPWGHKRSDMTEQLNHHHQWLGFCISRAGQRFHPCPGQGTKIPKAARLGKNRQTNKQKTLTLHFTASSKDTGLSHTMLMK